MYDCQEASLKNPKGRDAESFRVGEHMEAGRVEP